jgi:hypothetical protein
MGASALRVTACAGVLMGGLVFGTGEGAAGADPGGVHLRGDGKLSTDHLGGHHRFRGIGERRKRHAIDESTSAPTAFGADPASKIAASAVTATTDVTDPPAPDLAPGEDRQTTPDGTDGGTEGTDPGADTQGPDLDAGGADSLGNAEVAGAGSDNAENTAVSDNTVVATTEPTPEPETVTTSTGVVDDYPFLYYLLEVRRGGGSWWNATRIISRFEEVINPPAPEPEPMPAPAFRGPAPEAPAPEPVIDVSGGVGGGGSDYQPTDFGGAPVLQAPVIAVPVLPPAAVRFPSAATGAALSADTGAARGGGPVVEPGSVNTGARLDATQSTPQAGTVRSMAGQVPRQKGYPNYLRSAGLTEMAGAALPGVAGILLMTLGGTVVGYRQANAGRMVRMTSAARYLP